VEALRLLARRPNAEYGAANYPVRLYEHSLACVGAIDDFVSAIRDRRPPLCSIEEPGDGARVPRRSGIVPNQHAGAVAEFHS
jgi:hypothetical protein